MDKIVHMLLGDLRQIAWIIRMCEGSKVVVENCRVCQLKQACCATETDAVETGLEDACNRACNSWELPRGEKASAC